ncbi:M15 family metallopeptidase [Roseburia hominis]
MYREIQKKYGQKNRRKDLWILKMCLLIIFCFVCVYLALPYVQKAGIFRKFPSSKSANTKTANNKATNNNSTNSNAANTENGLSSADSQDSEDDWKLLLVNPWNALPENYSVNLTRLQNGHSVDERCYPALQDMMDACRAAGYNPLICSSYRTWDYQENLYNKEVNAQIALGYSKEEAKEVAATMVAIPGYSEHQLGLAVDIVDRDYQLLDKAQENTAVQKWLMEHCWEYGFILRYPNDKSELTGVIYEPWHYRYVGKKAAKEIMKAGICLEEYLGQ